jgi:exo-1,4-beta-D-glucosaminidase
MRPSARRPQLVLTTLAVLASALTAASASASASSAPVPAASGAPAASAPARQAPAVAPVARTAAAVLASSSATGASDLANLGARGWKVHSATGVTRSGARISRPGFHARGWLRVSNDDAGAPGTEIEALLQNGRCPDVFFSDNMRKCFGYARAVGRVKVPRFAVPWWWRTDFTARPRAGRDAKLIINGVIGAANVWVNGRKLAGAATVTGAYARFTFDITRLLRPRRNSLAIEVRPNNPIKMFTLDDVDWNQIPPDNNTGIQFPVQLQLAGPLADGNAHVIERNAAGLASSALTVKADITNSAPSPQTGTVTATITPPAGGGPAVTVSQPVTVPPRTTRTVTLRPARFPALTIRRPLIWWPYQLGRQPLYTLSTSVSRGGATLNSASEQFGIRTITSSLVGRSPEAPRGVRSFAVNGVPIVIRGGGFSPNLFLHYSAANTARQIALMKNLGINAIRLEGHLMPADFYRQMDRAGILINAGYQCCDAWQLPSSGRGVTRADYRLLRRSALAIGQELRNHPSVFSFQWSDNAPIRRQEAVSLAAFRQADFDDPIISSAEYNSSPVLGPAGEKEGPYDWVPPDYWYDTTHFDPSDPTRTNVGGSWGYDSEQSAGDTVPTIDSLNRFMSRADEARLWRNPRANQYHANYEGTGHRGYAFGTLFNFDTALRHRYGPWSHLASFVEKAQVQNYENTRAQFEAFIDHAHHAPTPATGTIYWQLNKGWPSLLWNLYGGDGDQPGSYFGAQQANQRLHALYALDTGEVTLDNLGGTAQSGLSVESRVYSLTGKLLDDQRASGLSLASQQVRTGVLRPRVPAVTAPPARARAYFVELLLRQGSSLVDRNVYWLSTQRDIVNWKASLGNPQATMTRYANLRALSTLPRARVSVTARTARPPGPAGVNLAPTVTITNTSPGRTVAFFLRADVRRGTARGTVINGDNELQSSIWAGNDITLWPGESQTLTVTYDAADLHGATPVISVSGWNVPRLDIAAPLGGD